MPLSCHACSRPLVLRLLFSCPFEEDLCLRCRLCGHYVQEGELTQAGVPTVLVSQLTPWSMACRELLAYCCGQAGVELPDSSYVARWRQLERETNHLVQGLRVFIPGLSADALDHFSRAVDWENAKIARWRLEQLRWKLLACWVSLSGDLQGFDPERLPKIPFSISPDEQSFVQSAWTSYCETARVFGDMLAKNAAAQEKLSLLQEAFLAGGVDDLRRVARDLALLA